MIRLCAWCGAEMGEKWPFWDKSVTHGICDSCREKIDEEQAAYEAREETACSEGNANSNSAVS